MRMPTQEKQCRAPINERSQINLPYRARAAPQLLRKNVVKNDSSHDNPIGRSIPRMLWNSLPSHPPPQSERNPIFIRVISGVFPSEIRICALARVELARISSSERTFTS